MAAHSYHIFISTFMFLVFVDGITFPLHKTMHNQSISHLLAQDKTRQSRRLLQVSPGAGVVQFPLQGSYDPYAAGFYYTRVLLGSPPVEFHVLIDTGSELSWVNCASCSGCPSLSELPIQLELFNPASSSTSSLIQCSDQQCPSNHTACSAQNNTCNYNILYADHSEISGYYVVDNIHLDIISENSTTSSTASIVFGCTTTQHGYITQSGQVLDGVLGFNQKSMSIISQLSTQHAVPKTFSHCLREDGGGFFILGDVVELPLTYTPLLPPKQNYHVHLEGINIDGQILEIDPDIFAKQRTVLDSGTYLVYLAEEVFSPLVHVIYQSASPHVSPIPRADKLCYHVQSSPYDLFPLITLNLKGGASMVLSPKDYLIRDTTGGNTDWCLGFFQSQYPRLQILGELVMRDRVITYDLENQRVGLTEFDCSTPVNFSSAPISNDSHQYILKISPRSQKILFIVFMLTVFVTLLISLYFTR